MKSELVVSRWLKVKKASAGGLGWEHAAGGLAGQGVAHARAYLRFVSDCFVLYLTRYGAGAARSTHIDNVLHSMEAQHPHHSRSLPSHRTRTRTAPAPYETGVPNNSRLRGQNVTSVSCQTFVYLFAPSCMTIQMREGPCRSTWDAVTHPSRARRCEMLSSVCMPS